VQAKTEERVGGGYMRRTLNPDIDRLHGAMMRLVQARFLDSEAPWLNWTSQRPDFLAQMSSAETQHIFTPQEAADKVLHLRIWYRMVDVRSSYAVIAASGYSSP